MAKMKRDDGLTKDERKVLTQPFQANPDSARFPAPKEGKGGAKMAGGKVMFHDKRLGWYNADTIDPDNYVESRAKAKKKGK